MVIFLDPEHVSLGTKIMILSGLAYEIFLGIGFSMMAIIKIQDGYHKVSGGDDEYKIWKTKAMDSMWKKSRAFSGTSTSIC